MRRLSIGVFGAGITLAVTGGWVLIVLGVVIISRVFFGVTPSPTTVFGATAGALILVTCIAFVIALLRIRELD